MDTIVDLLLERARARPDALAFVALGEPISYRRLAGDALALAGVLAARGLGPGARCALVLPTGLDFVRAVYATQILGAAPVAINPALPPDAIERRLRLTGAALALTPETVAALAREPCAAPARPAARPEDPAFLQLTSGTTGEPRAAIVLHQSLAASLDSAVEAIEPRPSDVLVGWVPLHHDLGLVRFVFSPVRFGCPAHLVAPSMSTLRLWLETIARERGTITGAPDFVYRAAARLVDPAGLDLSSLRYATNGGEAVRRSTIEAFERRFATGGAIRPGYGLAEATLGVTGTRPGESVETDAAGAVSCGRALPQVEVRIGPDGEILARGPNVFAGYFGDEAATREVLRDGWLHTGDIGALDAEGRLFVKGRRRALIKRAGALVAPREVEEAADRVPGVRFSAAVGVESSPGGTEDVVIVAEVKPEDAATGAARERLSRAIADEVVRALGFPPREVRLVAPRAIPRTANGKIRYDELRALVRGGLGIESAAARRCD